MLTAACPSWPGWRRMWYVEGGRPGVGGAGRRTALIGCRKRVSGGGIKEGPGWLNGLLRTGP